MDKKDSFTITILALVLFIEISIHLKTLKIICPRRVFCGNPRGSGVRPRSRGLEEKASGEDHMSRDRALALPVAHQRWSPPPSPATVRGRRVATAPSVPQISLSSQLQQLIEFSASWRARLTKANEKGFNQSPIHQRTHQVETIRTFQGNLKWSPLVWKLQLWTNGTLIKFICGDIKVKELSNS